MNNDDKLLKYISLEYLKNIKEGLEFDKSKLTNNIEENEKIIRSLCACFSGMFDIITSDKSLISYFNNRNSYLTNLSIYYIKQRISILNDENINLSNKLMLISILDLISVYMFINKEIFYNNEEYLDICMSKIINNLEIYQEYFIQNNIFDLQSGLGPISSSGFINDFIVIGNIVKDFYNKEIKKLKKV